MAFQIIQVVRECSMIGGAEAVCYELQRAWENAGVPATVLAAHCADDIHGAVRLCAGGGATWDAWWRCLPSR